MLELAEIFLAGLIAGAIDTAAGFGGALLLLPVLVQLVGSQDAVIISAVISLGWNVPRIVLLRKWIDMRSARALAAGALPGVFVGTWLLELIDPSLLRTAIGGLIICLGIYHIARLYIDLPRPTKLSWTILPAVGLVAGLLAALLGAGQGPMIAGALPAVGLGVRESAATNGALGGLLAIVRVAAYAVGDLLRSDHLLPSLVGALGGAAGALVGFRLSRRGRDSTLELLIGGVLLVAGVSLVM